MVEEYKTVGFDAGENNLHYDESASECILCDSVYVNGQQKIALRRSVRKSSIFDRYHLIKDRDVQDHDKKSSF